MTISNGNGTEFESNSVCNHTSDNKVGRLAAGVCFVYRDLLIKNYNYREKKNGQVMKDKEHLSVH